MSTVAAPSRRNGVDTAKLFATLDAVKAQPSPPEVPVQRASNRWISGTHSRTTISEFHGVGAGTAPHADVQRRR